MQAQMYQRTVHEWERQRLRLEFEHSELLSRVNYLAEEVGFHVLKMIMIVHVVPRSLLKSVLASHNFAYFWQCLYS
jgi:hypothetical protein